MEYGKRTFDLAVMNGHLSTAGRFVLASERMEDLTFETRPLVFHWACKNKRVDVARNIVEHDGTEWKDDDGQTLLHYAADHGNCDLVDVLLSKKADADASDKSGRTLLHFAAELDDRSAFKKATVSTKSLEDPGCANQSVYERLILKYWVVLLTRRV
ncbi:acyl-CoA-binding domain-containing protein 6-like [Corticium candelabrum]|uniref:acyl-CoA-binding domain-containing protein 6-like n=1 Tax=Corticium candelabrum TaxID=121492 RepID=UPI002E263BE8|nr:acyl-CoA-binding domain-containing protein 6-like [Corticium candelabrum]